MQTDTPGDDISPEIPVRRAVMSTAMVGAPRSRPAAPAAGGRSCNAEPRDYFRHINMKSLFRILVVLAGMVVPAAGQGGAAPPVPQPEPAAEGVVVAKPAEVPADAPKPKRAHTLKELIEQGGFTIWVLIGLSTVMIALILFYVLTIRRGTVVSDHFMHTADMLIRKQDYLGLLAVCNQRSESIARITQKALDFATKNPMATFEEVRRVTEAEGQRQAGQLTQRVTYLWDVGAVAPMVGLLGTVIGIMREFSQIANTNNLAAQLDFAGGTAEALINTAAGLLIAIPSMIVYSIYRGKVNSLVSELEAAATHIMALLGAQYKRMAAARAARPQQPSARRP